MSSLGESLINAWVAVLQIDVELLLAVRFRRESASAGPLLGNCCCGPRSISASSGVAMIEIGAAGMKR